MGNLDFEGGAVGINMNNQQYNIKSCTFTGTNTGIYISHGFDMVFQDMQFTNCEVGVNATNGGVGNVGSFALVDSVAQSVDTVIVTKSQKSATSGATTGDDSVIIDNLQTINVGRTVVAGETTLLEGSVPKTWVYGNAYLRGGPVAGVHDSGTTYQTSRSPALLSGGSYFTLTPPTYQEYSVNQVVNIKTVRGFPVHGDGQAVSAQSSARLSNTYLSVSGRHTQYQPHSRTQCRVCNYVLSSRNIPCIGHDLHPAWISNRGRSIFGHQCCRVQIL